MIRRFVYLDEHAEMLLDGLRRKSLGHLCHIMSQDKISMFLIVVFGLGLVVYLPKKCHTLPLRG